MPTKNGNKKTLPEKEGIKQSGLLSLDQHARHARLLTVRSILGNNALRSGLVHSGRGGAQHFSRRIGIELLQRSLGSGLHHLVAQSLMLGDADALDRRLDVRHVGIHLLRCIQIISMDYCITFIPGLQGKFTSFRNFLLFSLLRQDRPDTASSPAGGGCGRLPASVFRENVLRASAIKITTAPTHTNKEHIADYQRADFEEPQRREAHNAWMREYARKKREAQRKKAHEAEARV